MTLRPATPADLPAILALLARVIPQLHAQGNFQWDDHYPTREVFLHDIARYELWLAEIDGQLAGFITITTAPEPAYEAAGLDSAEPAIVTHRLAVDLAFRGQGIGIALLNHAEVLARELAIPVLRLDTSHSNATTQSLFPKLGYRFAGEITLAHRPGMRVLCYEKRLAPETP
jgi:ribosomal protein S18 acetylase RimI-like enzyme